MKKILCQFKGATEETSLEQKEKKLYLQFCNMARELLYGGYFLIDEKKKIFLDDIEFYYHEESENFSHTQGECYTTNNLYDGKIKDPIMYHSNDHEGHELPYFSIGRLNMHASGVDITFENEEKHYRASFLIRGFHVNNQPYDSHSTHIYDEMLYMGVPLGKSIEVEWITEDLTGKESYIPQGSPRKNVAEEYVYEKYKTGNGEWKKKITTDIVQKSYEKDKYFKSSEHFFRRCQRSWRFKKVNIPD